MWSSQANSDHTKRAANLSEQDSALTDLDVNEQVSIFNDTATNIMSNVVPIEIIICENRGTLQMNRHLKYVILHKDNFYIAFVRAKNIMFHI